MRYSLQTGPSYNPRMVGAYEFDNLPGCSQVVVSHSMFLNPEERGKKLSEHLAMKRVFHARDLVYDYMLCTVCSTNKAQIKIIERIGWERLASFKSSKTEHDVIIFGRKI